jgi:HSP20 family protein
VYREEEATVEAQLVRARADDTPPAEIEASIIDAQSGDDVLGDDFDDAEGHLTIDVYQNLENITIESTIAGVGPDDIDIAITPESVAIKGKRERKEKVKKGDYLHQECFWGKFSRSIILPQEIDPDRAHASLKDGVLKIILPKVHRDRTKKVKVRLD